MCTCPGNSNQVGHKFGADRDPGLNLSILAAISVVRDHRCNPLGRRSSKGIHDNQKLHDIVIDGRAGGLEDKGVPPPDIFLYFN